MTPRETRDMFTALFESYSEEPIKAIHLKEIMTRKGGLVKDQLTFDEEKVDNIPPRLKTGDYAAFVADLEFKNVQFLKIFNM